MPTDSTAAGAPTPERIHQLAFGFAAPLILEAAVRLGLVDVLEDGAKPLEEIAGRIGASPRGTRALLDALVGLEFLRKQQARYELTDESAAFLVSSRPEFQGGIFKHVSRQLLPHWMELTESVRTGRPAAAVNRRDIGGEFFRQFVEDLFPRGYPVAQRVAEELKIAEAVQPVRVLDVAAGSGVWSIALAECSPHVTVTAVDWPEVIPVTRRVAEGHGLAGRYKFVAGDLLEVDFGGGFHIATLGHILHSEGEARSRRLLEKVFEATAPGGTVVIAEIVPDEDRAGPAHTLIFAVNMLVHTEEGDTFTFGEISSWLREAGFENHRRLEAPAPSPLILADKPRPSIVFESSEG